MRRLLRTITVLRRAENGKQPANMGKSKNHAHCLKSNTGRQIKEKPDINPMWRLKTLTEQFGPCGVGWKYEIAEKRLELGAGDEIAAFVDINLYVKVGDVWSEAIPGTGGSSFVAKESKGLYTNDECFKMALTDAISVSCKALGFGADVYWDKDRTKYDDKGNNGHGAGNNEPEKPKQSQPNSLEKTMKPLARPCM